MGFLLFPISQLLMMWSLTDQEMNYLLKLGYIGGTGIIVGFIADIVLLYTFLAQGEKDALARQVQELEHLRQVERLHYQSIEMRREELAKIRHDFNNQLATALALIQHQDTGQAVLMMDDLKESISRTKEYVWCGEPVVNAVLGEQAAACEAEGIALQAEIELDSVSGIEPVHLCSVFSNLLDNARRGAGQCAEGERSIVLKAVQHGEYLHIKVENSAVSPEEKPRKGHGYGQEILRDIASQYNGEFRKEWKEGTYSAYLSLECRGREGL